MTPDEFAKTYPWVDPTLGYPNDTLREGVRKLDKVRHVAVRVGAAHKSVPYMEAYHSRGLQRINDNDWRLFGASLTGTIDGKEYLWGMFVEGIGAFNAMVPAEFARDLLASEREYLSGVTYGMYGSHSGKLSYTMPSRVAPLPLRSPTR